MDPADLIMGVGRPGLSSPEAEELRFKSAHCRLEGDAPEPSVGRDGLIREWMITLQKSPA